MFVPKAEQANNEVFMKFSRAGCGVSQVSVVMSAWLVSGLRVPTYGLVYKVAFSKGICLLHYTTLSSKPLCMDGAGKCAYRVPRRLLSWRVWLHYGQSRGIPHQSGAGAVSGPARDVPLVLGVAEDHGQQQDPPRNPPTKPLLSCSKECAHAPFLELFATVLGLRIHLVLLLCRILSIDLPDQWRCCCAAAFWCSSLAGAP